MRRHRGFGVYVFLLLLLVISMLQCVCGANDFLDQRSLLVHESRCNASSNQLFGALRGAGARKQARTSGADVSEERQGMTPVSPVSLYDVMTSRHTFDQI
jgi:hypothetical protein